MEALYGLGEWVMGAEVSIHQQVKTGGAEKLHALLAGWGGTQQELTAALNEHDEHGAF
jgi:hypothetical protein